MKIARVHNSPENVGRGVVQSVHENLTEALDQTPKDRDGCKHAYTCYWRVSDDVRVGQTVVAGNPTEV